MFIKTSYAKNDDGTKRCTYEIVKSYREKGNKNPTHKVISNITHLPESIRSKIALLLKAPKSRIIEDFENFFQKSYNYGDCLFLYQMVKRCGIYEAFDELPEKSKRIITAAIISRILSPRSKLSSVSFMRDNALHKLIAAEPEKIHVNQIYKAMDVFYKYSEKIFQKIYKQNSNDNKLLLYDITSIYFEGLGPEDLAKLGYSRDKRPDAVQIILLLCLNEKGFPIYFDIREGNTQDKKTVVSVLKEIEKNIKIKETIFVGDRGMISVPNISHLESEEIDYILALTHTEMRGIVYEQDIDIDLFDKELPAIVFEESFEIDCNGEKKSKKRKYVLCGSKYRKEHDTKVLNKLLERGKNELEKIKERIRKGRLKKHDVIIRHAQKKLTQCKCEKFYDFKESNGEFIIIEKPFIEKAKKMCGYYMLKTTASNLKSTDIEQNYKSLQIVERAFKDLKNIVDIRPVYHYKNIRVRTHIMLCIFSQSIVRAIKKTLIEKKWFEKDPENSFASFIDLLGSIKIGVFNIDNTFSETVSVLTEKQKNILKLFEMNTTIFTSPFSLM